MDYRGQMHAWGELGRLTAVLLQRKFYGLLNSDYVISTSQILWQKRNCSQHQLSVATLFSTNQRILKYYRAMKEIVDHESRGRDVIGRRGTVSSGNKRFRGLALAGTCPLNGG